MFVEDSLFEKLIKKYNTHLEHKFKELKNKGK
jgi:hypothetical protein